MTVTGWIQIIVLVAVLTLLTPLLGGYMARVYRRERVRSYLRAGSGGALPFIEPFGVDEEDCTG